MMASPVIADANKVGFSSVALATPVLADDELVTDKWLAMLEQRAKEKWWLQQFIFNNHVLGITNTQNICYIGLMNDY